MDNDIRHPTKGVDARMRAEAEIWLARMQGQSCSARQRWRFRQWLSRPGNRQAYAAAERAWEELGRLAASTRLQRMAAEALAATAPAPRSEGRRLAGWALAAALALLALWPIRQGMLPTSGEMTLSTLPGQRSVASLPDGSLVSLNVDTRLTYRFGEHGRDLRLIKGEAYFSVAHDASRPFRVVAGNGDVVALGTRFQVRQHDSRVEVTLLEGSVQVQRADSARPVRIRPGMQASYWQAGSDGAIRVQPVDIEVASAWTRGRLLFRSVPLSEFITEVNRYGTRKILLDAPSLAAFPISGTFPIGDNHSAALALESVLPLHADFSNPDRIVLSPAH